MFSEKLMQYVLQGVVAVGLLILAGLQIWRGGPVETWLAQVLVILVGALFGVSALNGFIAHNKK